MLGRERRQKLAAALARLPERQRSVFMLSHYEGCTSREVSALTGLNESTVRVHLFRAIRRLRTLLRRGCAPASEWEEKAPCHFLDPIGRAAPHLSDDAVAELWSAAAATRRARQPTRTSPTCAQCRARYAAFAGWLDGVRDDARREADEVFPAERLAAQQAQIVRRLEALERPARVIAFPRFARPVTSDPGPRAALGGRRRPRPASSSAWRPGSSSTFATRSTPREAGARRRRRA